MTPDIDAKSSSATPLEDTQMKNEKNHEVLKSIVIGLVAHTRSFAGSISTAVPNQKPKERSVETFRTFDPAKMTNPSSPESILKLATCANLT